MRFVAGRIIVAAAALWLFSGVLLAQEFSQIKLDNNAPPKHSGVTPRAPDGHPDLTGVWNGLGDNLLGVPNQIANNGIAIENENYTHGLHSGAAIATFPRNTTLPLNPEETQRTASLRRRGRSKR